jgi:hypothetical protein
MVNCDMDIPVGKDHARPRHALARREGSKRRGYMAPGLMGMPY